jgi:type III restriction enzyme
LTTWRFESAWLDEDAAALANLRLQAIAWLPNLAVFRDPRTIDYLAKETDLVVTANATGTPHFERQPLRHDAGNKLED